MTDREFWMQLRRGLVGLQSASRSADARAAIGQMIAAIDRRFGLAETT